jgi:hypothetical protein
MWWRRCLHRPHGAITDPRPGRTEGKRLDIWADTNDPSDTPVLIGEHVRGLEPKADLVVAGGTDLLRSDLEYDLGITGAVKIAHLGEALGMDVEIHASGPTHRARMSAMPNTNWYEVALVAPGARSVAEAHADDYSDDPDGPVIRRPVRDSELASALLSSCTSTCAGGCIKLLHGARAYDRAGDDPAGSSAL